MALGAVKVIRKSSVDGLGLWVVDITGATSYTTGGDALTVTTLGASATAKILGVFIMPSGTTNTPLVVWDPALQTVKAYGTAAGATGLTECSAAGNFSSHTYRALVLLNTIG